MPESLEATYDAIRHGAAWRVVERDAVVVSGPGALEWLQGQVSQDIASLGEHNGAGASGLDTLVLSPQGKVESFCRMSRLEAEVYLLDLRAGFGKALHERLRRFKLRVKADLELMENLQVAQLRGPLALESAEPFESDGVTVVARSNVSWPGWSGQDLLFTAGPEKIDFATVRIGATSIGDDEAFEAARIEAGVPELGSELTERTIPQEAGDLVARAVSFTKGCYTGQELVARIDARGSNTPRRLQGVVFEGAPGDAAPAAGDVLEIAGDDVGQLTSVAWSPGLGGHVALAYVKRATKAPVEVDVTGAARGRRGTIRALPLFEK
jgi:folate-binding protein YgfZ